MTNRFIAVANLDSQDFDAVREGFERVIRPRLADARFFWDQDNKSSIDDWAEQLIISFFKTRWDQLETNRDVSH